MINSRQKGKRGERAFRDVLREAGYLKARRGQQYAGGNQSPDVVCEELPSIHWEVKYCEKGNLYDWIEQATGDTWMHERHGRMLKIPIVAHKRNGKKWIAILPLEGLGLLEIIRRSDLPKVYRCVECGAEFDEGWPHKAGIMCRKCYNDFPP
jgi:Holliday junction resolvase